MVLQLTAKTNKLSSILVVLRAYLVLAAHTYSNRLRTISDHTQEDENKTQGHELSVQCTKLN